MTSAAYKDASLEAFSQARAFFQAELSTKEQLQADSDIFSHTSLGDVQKALSSASESYKAKPRSKALKWLTRLSAFIGFYGQTLDVLAQHHPEYTALAWGAFKFLFTTVCNHEKLIKELSKTLYQIGSMLPQVKLALDLYPTDAMIEAVTPLYVTLLRIAMKSIKWYKNSRIMHVLDAVTSPWALHFEDDVTDMQNHFANITSHAASAARAELRDVHNDTRSAANHQIEAAKKTLAAEVHLQNIEAKVATAEQQLERLTGLMERRTDELMKFAATQQKIQQEIALDLQSQSETTKKIALAQIWTLPFARELPPSGECLAYCQSFRRRLVKTRITVDTETMDRWSTRESTAVVVLKGLSGRQADKLLLEVLQLIRQSGRPMLWALRFRGMAEKHVTTCLILQLLTIQALQMNGAVMVSGPYAITQQSLNEAAAEKDWLEVLGKALQGMKDVFIVIDSDLLNEASERNRWEASDFVKRLTRGLAAHSVKILVSSTAVQHRSTQQSDEWQDEWQGEWMEANVEARRPGMSAGSARLKALHESRRRKKMR